MELSAGGWTGVNSADQQLNKAAVHGRRNLVVTGIVSN